MCCSIQHKYYSAPYLKVVHLFVRDITALSLSLYSKEYSQSAQVQSCIAKVLHMTLHVVLETCELPNRYKLIDHRAIDFAQRSKLDSARVGIAARCTCRCTRL